jgi:hypothetical protein
MWNIIADEGPLFSKRPMPDFIDGLPCGHRLGEVSGECPKTDWAHPPRSNSLREIG